MRTVPAYCKKPDLLSLDGHTCSRQGEDDYSKLTWHGLWPVGNGLAMRAVRLVMANLECKVLLAQRNLFVDVLSRSVRADELHVLKAHSLFQQD